MWHNSVMGMFDYIHCHVPLPVPGFSDMEFQTKDTPAQGCEYYVISDEGMLTDGHYQVSFTGEIRFYTFPGFRNGQHAGWIEFSAYFRDGRLIDGPSLIKHESV
jgi:hypothetical protein